MAKRNQRQRAACPFELSMDLVSGKWKGMIIFKLKENPHRFTDLKKCLGDVSNRMLTLALRELEEDGLVIRHVKSAVPPEVEYSLTEIGKQLIPVFMQMRSWGLLYKEQINLGE